MSCEILVRKWIMAPILKKLITVNDGKALNLFYTKYDVIKRTDYNSPAACTLQSQYNTPIFCTILRTWHEKMKLGTYCTTFIFKIFQFCPVRANVVHMTINTATWPHVASVQVFYSFPENKICMIGKKMFSCLLLCAGTWGGSHKMKFSM